MTKTVKTCKEHGDLTVEQCYVNTYVTKGGLSHHYKCRQCTTFRMRKWTTENKHLISQRHKDKGYSKKYYSELTDSYIKNLLSKQYKCSADIIPDKVLPLKRQDVELQRAKEPIPEKLTTTIHKLMLSAVADGQE